MKIIEMRSHEGRLVGFFWELEETDKTNNIAICSKVEDMEMFDKGEYVFLTRP